ncbi:hypothetical protein ACFQY7_23760 [Actinomadura luteofluorescens]|uniref:Uncharacterized protein n=1 Tax=Actinomadura luteofluorescens TaxID=46163 RepID=A0A7Y9ENG2_9ACTN|nr:hypothetical protein [Actinomadura luteofluorescens]NYD50839.1 hypothetical protein [Actinomadura luteofluorescens]
MITPVDVGPYRSALVIRYEDGVDDALLSALADATGLTFAYYGNGGFGGETLADVYADASGRTLLIEVAADEVGVKAVFVRAESADEAVAIRAVIGEHVQVWTEQTLRAQLEGTLSDAPWTLVALMMATGGAEPDPETADLLQRALGHGDGDVREAAEYARAVAAELVHAPVVMREAPRERPTGVLAPARPVEGEEDWVTVRPGIPNRAVPRPVVWVRLATDDAERAAVWAFTEDWNIAVVGRDTDGSGWKEAIYTTMDEETALHIVEHPALGTVVHTAVHGTHAEATAAALREALGGEILDGAPPGLERTARSPKADRPSGGRFRRSRSGRRRPR